MPVRQLIFISLILLLSPTAVWAKPEVNLPVPFTSEIPDGIWAHPWSNACEEASVVMIEKYYLKKKDLKIPKARAKQEMKELFAWEDKIFGSNTDTNAAQTVKMINDYSSFEATVKRNPTLEEIKKELSEGRPVISLHHGQALNNPHHRWRVTGSYYHMMVLVGFDDATQEFIVNDPADHTTGLDYRYKYATILDTLRDFDHATHKVIDEPTVLFTAPKKLIQVKGKSAIYWVENNIKYYISHPQVFKNHRWSWGLVEKVDQSYLDGLTPGSTISK